MKTVLAKTPGAEADSEGEEEEKSTVRTFSSASFVFLLREPGGRPLLGLLRGKEPSPSASSFFLRCFLTGGSFPSPSASSFFLRDLLTGSFSVSTVGALLTRSDRKSKRSVPSMQAFLSPPPC